MNSDLSRLTYPRGRIGGLYTYFFTVIFLFSMIFPKTLQAEYQGKLLTLNYQEVSIKQLLMDIERTSDYAFIYQSNEIPNYTLENVAFKDAKVEQVLASCLDGQQISYKIVNNHIILSSFKEEPRVEEKKKKQKLIKIQGVVLDEAKQPLPGAAIVIPGTTLGAATNVDGKFEMMVLPTDKAVMASFIGYEAKRVELTGTTPLRIILQPAQQEIEEVVVTGIFTRKAESYSGAARTVKGEDLLAVGNSNILQSLGSIDPSFQIIENNQFGSDPNRVPEIQMRGASSFSDMKDKYQTNPNQPLFIVDGFEQSISKVMDMDMNRVSSVTLLKDATAKALYGSKGANGVVVIETIKPKMGQLMLSYTGSVEVEVPDLSSYNLANAAQKLEIEKNAGVYTSPTNNPSEQLLLDEMYANLYKEVQQGVDTDWLSKPTRTGIGTKHSLNFEGGDAYMRYNVNVHYQDIAGVMKGSERQNIGGEMMLSYRYNNFLFREQLILSHNKANNSPYGSFSEYAKMNPYWRAYDEDGSVREVLGVYNLANQQGEEYIYNPMINAELNTNDVSKYTDITNNFYIEWDVFKALKLTGRAGVTYRADETDVFYPRDHTKFKDVTVDSENYFERGEYTKENGKSINYTIDLGASYNKTINNHLFFLNGQWSIAENRYENVVVRAEGFANNKMDYITNALQYIDGDKPTGEEALDRSVSGLLAFSYSYDSRYLLDANYRGNASSLFGKDKRWGHFWSVGAGWNIHNEDFMKESPMIQQMKFRVSTGYTGSQNFNSYQAMSTYRYFNDVVYDNIIGAYLLSLANPELAWQQTQDNNIGLDLRLFNRFDVSVDYYIKNTKNLLTPITIAPSSGFSEYTENLGKTENKGIEARIQYQAISSAQNDINLNLFASVMHNKNKIVKINESLQGFNDLNDKELGELEDDHKEKEDATKPSVRYIEGESMDAIWAVQSLGINPANGNELFLDKNGNMTETWSADDMIVAGDGLPKATGTFGLNLDVKGFTLNTSFYYRLGGQVYNQTLVDKVEDADIQYNVDARVYEGRWTTPGQKAQYKKLSYPNYFTRPTTRFVQNLSELNMTTLAVGYDFRNWNFIKKGAINRLKVTFYLNDLARWSTIDIERGTDYPFARSGSCQVQLTF